MKNNIIETNTLPMQGINHTSAKNFIFYNWLDAWDKTISGSTWKSSTEYWVWLDQNKTLMFFPYAHQRQLSLLFHSLSGPYFPYRSFYAQSENLNKSIRYLAEFINKNKSISRLRLGPVIRNGREISELAKNLEGMGWILFQKEVGCNYILEIPDSFTQLESHVGKKIRKHITYYERRLNKEGLLEIQYINDVSHNSWMSVLSDLCEVESHSWQKDKNTNLRFLGKKNRDFWRFYFKSTLAQKNTHCWIMKFNNDPISCCFTIDESNTRHVLVNLYNKSFKKYMTGSILYKHMLKDACDNSLKFVNMGLGDSGYKSKWGSKPTQTLVEIMMFKPSSMNRLLSALIMKMKNYKKLKFQSSK